MVEIRKGRQTPTQSVILPYFNTKGEYAIKSYNESVRTVQEWQELLLCDILAVNYDRLWVHTKFGYEVPRRNGKMKSLRSESCMVLKTKKGCFIRRTEPQPAVRLPNVYLLFFSYNTL